MTIPLQVIDNFLLQYNVGQALLLIFLLAVLAAVVSRSRKVLAIQFVSFGLIYMLTPQSLLTKPHWKFLGIALLMIGPMLYITARK